MTGEWEMLAAAERTYRNWIGLYDSHPTAVIQELATFCWQEGVLSPA